MYRWESFGIPEGRPSGRWGFSAAAVLPESDPFVVVWGGLKDGEVLGDMYVYHVASGRWRKAPQTGEQPSTRWGASLTPSPVSNQNLSLVMLGGREGSKPMPLSQYYVMDLKSLRWTKYDIPSLEGARSCRPGGHAPLYVARPALTRCVPACWLFGLGPCVRACVCVFSLMHGLLP